MKNIQKLKNLTLYIIITSAILFASLLLIGVFLMKKFYKKEKPKLAEIITSSNKSPQSSSHKNDSKEVIISNGPNTTSQTQINKDSTKLQTAKNELSSLNNSSVKPQIVPKGSLAIISQDLDFFNRDLTDRYDQNNIGTNRLSIFRIQNLRNLIKEKITKNKELLLDKFEREYNEAGFNTQFKLNTHLVRNIEQLNPETGKELFTIDENRIYKKSDGTQYTMNRNFITREEIKAEKLRSIIFDLEMKFLFNFIEDNNFIITEKAKAVISQEKTSINNRIVSYRKEDESISISLKKMFENETNNPAKTNKQDFTKPIRKLNFPYNENEVNIAEEDFELIRKFAFHSGVFHNYSHIRKLSEKEIKENSEILKFLLSPDVKKNLHNENFRNAVLDAAEHLPHLDRFEMIFKRFLPSAKEIENKLLGKDFKFLGYFDPKDRKDILEKCFNLDKVKVNIIGKIIFFANSFTPKGEKRKKLFDELIKKDVNSLKTDEKKAKTQWYKNSNAIEQYEDEGKAINNEFYRLFSLLNSEENESFEDYKNNKLKTFIESDTNQLENFYKDSQQKMDKRLEKYEYNQDWPLSKLTNISHANEEVTKSAVDHKKFN